MAFCGSNLLVDDELLVVDSKMSSDIIPLYSASGGPNAVDLGKNIDEYKFSDRDSVIPINLEVDDKVYRSSAGTSVIKMSSGPFYNEERHDSVVNLEPEANLLKMLTHEEVFDIVKKASSPPLRSPPIMLYGAPGTGKTRIVEQAVKEVGNAINVYSLGTNELKGAKKKDVIQLLEDIFVKASSNAPSVVFLDNVDLLPSSASKLLTINREGVQVFAATNIPHKMDSNILQAFVDKHHLSLPSIQTIRNLFKTELESLAKCFEKKENEIAIERLAVANLSLSEVNTCFTETLASNNVTYKVFDKILEKLQSNYDGKYFMIMHNWSARSAN